MERERKELARTSQLLQSKTWGSCLQGEQCEKFKELLRKQKSKRQKMIERNSWVFTAQEYHDAKVKHFTADTLLSEPSDKERKSFQWKTSLLMKLSALKTMMMKPIVSFRLMHLLDPLTSVKPLCASENQRLSSSELKSIVVVDD